MENKGKEEEEEQEEATGWEGRAKRRNRWRGGIKTRQFQLTKGLKEVTITLFVDFLLLKGVIVQQLISWGQTPSTEYLFNVLRLFEQIPILLGFVSKGSLYKYKRWLFDTLLHESIKLTSNRLTSRE